MLKHNKAPAGLYYIYLNGHKTKPLQFSEAQDKEYIKFVAIDTLTEDHDLAEEDDISVSIHGYAIYVNLPLK